MNRMATSQHALRARLQAALTDLAQGDLPTGATALLNVLGYASPKTLELPTQPQAFAHELENLVGGSKQLNPLHASLADWKTQNGPSMMMSAGVMPPSSAAL